MDIKPIVVGAALAVTAETIVHKEQTTPHPVEEQIQDPVNQGIFYAQMSGVDFYKMPDGTIQPRFADK